jgi:uncharacterized membrane protein
VKAIYRRHGHGEIKRRPTMSKQNQKSKKNSARLESKKAAVLGKDKKSNLPLILAACAVLIVGAGVFVLVNQGGGQPTATQGPVAVDTERVTFPATMFADGKARHFEHRNGRHTIRFFVLKSSDGIIRAAFDACDVCFPAGKGYYQEGDYMVCRNCGRRFASVLVNEVKGGCNPAPLNRSMKGDQVVTQVKDILEGERYFNFS